MMTGAKETGAISIGISSEPTDICAGARGFVARARDMMSRTLGPAGIPAGISANRVAFAGASPDTPRVAQDRQPGEIAVNESAFRARSSTTEP